MRRLIAVMVMTLFSGCMYGQAPGVGGSAVQDTYRGPVGTEDHPVRVSSGVMVSLLVHQEKPVFPEEARTAKVNGAVVMAAKVDKTGKIVDLKVISGPEVLRKPYMDAVRKWIYKPYLLNGQPVFVQTFITINIQMGS